MPAISDTFSVSVDELLGLPAEEKEKQAMELCKEYLRIQAQIVSEEEEKSRLPMLLDIIRKLKLDYAGCDSVWRFWIGSFDSLLKKEPLLSAVREFAEVRLEKCPQDATVIQRMATIENDEHIESFLKRYATEFDVSKEALLMNRYINRDEPHKAAPLKHKMLFETIDKAVNNRELYMETTSKTLEHCFAENTARLGILHAFNGETPTKEHPITCGSGVDCLAAGKLHIGIRRACYFASMGKPDEAFAVLEDIVSLLEEAMKITGKITLTTSRFTPSITWTAEESWYNVYSQNSVPLEKCVFIENSVGFCSSLFPSEILRILTAPHGWEWFDPIREDPRYQGYIERVKKLVEIKE